MVQKAEDMVKTLYKECIEYQSKIMREWEDNVIREMLISSCSTADPDSDIPTEVTLEDIHKVLNG